MFYDVSKGKVNDDKWMVRVRGYVHINVKNKQTPLLITLAKTVSLMQIRRVSLPRTDMIWKDPSH